MKCVPIIINGKEYLAQPGKNLLAAAIELGVDIPHLCYDPRIEAFGSCRLCFIHLKGVNKPVPACSLKVEADMQLITESPELFALRQGALELLLAEHCGDCFAPCQEACPAGIDIQGFIAHINNQDFASAGQLIRERMPLPSICGRVCPRFCEDSCRRNIVDAPVDICGLKRLTGDLWMEKLSQYAPRVDEVSGFKVAVVGGGPAGLTGAYYLALAGHEVTIYESNLELGGMLRYGIPEYRLPNKLLDQEIKVIADLCHRVMVGKKLGKDFTLDQLKKDFDGVFLGIGCQQPQMLDLPKHDLPGIHSGIDFLHQVTVDKNVKIGNRVAIIGGGNTAMDAARTALRLGAEEVMVFYRRTRDEMPAEKIEIEEALEEGVKFHFLTNPTAFIGTDRIRAIQLIKMELGPEDTSGRRRPVEIAGSEFAVPVDSVILALGQKTDSTVVGQLGLELTRWGTIATQSNLGASSQAGVFVAGDCVTGAATVVEAVAAARQAAIGLDAYLTKKVIDMVDSKPAFAIKQEEWTSLDEVNYANKPKIPRIRVRHMEASQRKSSFAEYCYGLNQEEALAEAKRCLECGCIDANNCALRDLAEKYQVELGDLEPTKQRYTIDKSHPYIHRDQNKCILCGKCVIICQEVIGVAAFGFVDRGFNTTVRPAIDQPLAQVCISCGACVSACPTGALTQNFPWVKKAAWDNRRKVSTTCLQCSIGCKINLELVGDKIINVDSSLDHPISQGVLCSKGSFGYDFVYSHRLLKPKLKSDNAYQEVKWDEALHIAATRLKTIKEEFGSDSLAIYVSPQLTNEAMATALDLAITLETQNIAGIGSNLYQTIPNAKAGIAELERSDLILVINTKLQEDYTPLAGIINRRARGANPVKVIHLCETTINLEQILTVTCDLLFQQPISHNIDPVIKDQATELIQMFQNAKEPLILLDEESLSGAAFNYLSRIMAAEFGKPDLFLIQKGGNSKGLLKQGIRTQGFQFESLRGLVIVGDDFNGFDRLVKDNFVLAITTSNKAYLEKADVILPGATFVESQGTVINNGGIVQTLQSAISPMAGRTNENILATLIYELTKI